MGFNLDCAGRTYWAPPERLDQARHADYARAVGADPEAGGNHPLACFAAVYLLRPLVEQLFGDAELGLDLAHLLHGEQEFQFSRPPRFGETLRPEAEIAAAELRRGMVFLDFRCRGIDESGEAVVLARSLFVVREQG